MNRPAERANSRGIEFEEQGSHAEAETAYRKAAALDPSWSVPWFNLGLLAKRQRRWADSIEHNRRATQLDPTQQGAWWNLGIGSTALGNWQGARHAWNACGIEVPPGDGPLRMNLGLVPIRIASNGEVLWCDRIDPARAIVRSVPLPESERGYGDLLLHDGAANGWRQYNSQQVPVFDEIELVEPSGLSTLEVMVVVGNPNDTEELSEIAQRTGLAAENWSETVRTLCAACSRGIPHEHEPQARPSQAERRVGIAAPDQRSVERLLAEWLAAAAAEVRSIELVRRPPNGGAAPDESGAYRC